VIDLLASAFAHVTSPVLPPGSSPHAWQLEIAETLLSGRRAVLRAPGGSGKSLAAWFPWLASRIQPYDFPPQLLHVFPGGTLIGNLPTQLTALSAFVPGCRISRQTEGDAFDPFLLSDAIFSTDEQMLSVALHQPLGLYAGLSNINAGALFGAYLIFDEIPSFISRERLMLWLGLLRQYYPTVPCLFMSATMSLPLARFIADALDAPLVEAGAEMIGGRRAWSRAAAFSAEALLRQHRERTLVVCNTVRGAQTLFRALRALRIPAGGPELLLLHQYQFSRERDLYARHAIDIFGPASFGNAILVTTSGIEAGVDLSADTVITDPASADALVRRASHCARYAREWGQMIVAPVSTEIDEITPDILSGHALLDLLADGEGKDAIGELAALDLLRVRGTIDAGEEITAHPPTLAEIDAAPAHALAGDETSHLFARIGVALHRLPETVADPFALERFSLSISSLERGWRQWQASGSPGEWFALCPHWSGEHKPSIHWSLVESCAQLHAPTRLLVLNAEAVSYHPVFGLELTPGTPYQSVCIPAQHTAWSPFDQHSQRFVDHAQSAELAFTRLLPWYHYILRHLGVRWRKPYMELEQWLRCGILWHDAGKLSAHWQQCAQRWQGEAMRRPVTGLLARVDFEYRRDGLFPCPEHAQTTAHVLARAWHVLLGGHEALYQGTLLALSHHHGQVTPVVTDLTPHPEAWTTLLGLLTPHIDERILRRVDRVGWQPTMRGLEPLAAHPPTDPDAWMAYSVLVRAIRLADREIALAEWGT